MTYLNKIQEEIKREKAEALIREFRLMKGESFEDAVIRKEIDEIRRMLNPAVFRQKHKATNHSR